jgi:hypothetical protein
LLICVEFGRALPDNPLAVVEYAKADEAVATTELSQIEHEFANDGLWVNLNFAVGLVRLVSSIWRAVNVIGKGERQMPDLVPIITDTISDLM